MRTLTPEQSEELADALNEALNSRGEGDDFAWDCDGDHARTVAALGDMGLTYEQTEAVVEELNDLGGHCDCEVMFNVVSGPGADEDSDEEN